ncbi:MAG: helix-turn-helix domain-containing protein [Ectothiorhodospiraceae bacterium]|nr:helix-turn-helix domain-containing protein [Ectothiorhodospiraceae bacterium]
MDGADRHFERSLGQRIRELRGRRSRDIFAAELGIHKNTLARYETGQRMPDAALIRRLCDLCGVAAESLLGAAESLEPDAAEDYIRPPLLRGGGVGVSPVSVHRKWVDAQRLPAERLRLYVVEDDALAPVVAAGEMLLV